MGNSLDWDKPIGQCTSLTAVQLYAMIQDFEDQSKGRNQTRPGPARDNKRNGSECYNPLPFLFLITKWFLGGAKTEVSKIIQATVSQIIAHLPFFYPKRFYHPERHSPFFVFYRGLRCAKIHINPSALKGWNMYVD